MTRADIRTLQDDHPMPEYVDSSGCLRTVDYRLFRASVGKATKITLKHLALQPTTSHVCSLERLMTNGTISMAQTLTPIWEHVLQQ